MLSSSFCEGQRFTNVGVVLGIFFCAHIIRPLNTQLKLHCVLICQLQIGNKHHKNALFLKETS